MKKEITILISSASLTSMKAQDSRSGREINLIEFKGVVDFFSRLDCVYGVQSNMCSCFFFSKKFHIIYLYSTPLCPFSDKRPDYFLVLCLSLRNTWLISWLSVLWFAKLPLVRVWTSRPSAQRHALRLYCKQWRRLYFLSIWARMRRRGY